MNGRDGSGPACKPQLYFDLVWLHSFSILPADFCGFYLAAREATKPVYSSQFSQRKLSNSKESEDLSWSWYFSFVSLKFSFCFKLWKSYVLILQEKCSVVVSAEVLVSLSVFSSFPPSLSLLSSFILWRQSLVLYLRPALNVWLSCLTTCWGYRCVLLHLPLFSSDSTKVLFFHYGWKSAILFACCLFLRVHKAD